VGPSGGL